MKDLGFYIHIPFCAKKCNYCDFFSFDNKFNLVEDYIECLIEEIQHFRKNSNEDFLVNTIYIGGGTPSVIDSHYIVKIMQTIKNNFNINENAEITIEVNPGTITKEKLEKYYNSGINRLSMGLQSANNDLLKLLRKDS